MFRTLKLASAIVLTLSAPAFAETVGVTATEIKVGGIFPYSGPASSLSTMGKGLSAYVQSINDRGGINGRKINYITYDDAYSPPKAVEQARKLVENDEVAFMFGQLGTASNTATAKYLASKGVPSLGITSGSDKFTVVADYPNVTTSIVSFVTEGKFYANYMKKVLPNAKYAILYQNDDLGKDYLKGFREVFKDDFDKKVVTASYELTDPTIDSQIVNLKNSGAEAFLSAGLSKSSAQAIRKINELGWKPLIILGVPSNSVAGTIKPAGVETSIGVSVGSFIKDPSDPTWKDDAGMKDYFAFAQKYLPGADLSDYNYLYGYTQGLILEQIIKQSGNDLSRENILKQGKSLKNLSLPQALPGILVNTSAEVNQHWTQLGLLRWNGKTWEAFGDAVSSK